MGIAKITLELEAITPSYISIGGADKGNIKNEGLRSQSLRGLMRWWFRAVVGGMVSSYSILRNKENEVFGSTNMKSKVIVISIPRMKQNKKQNNEDNIIYDVILQSKDKDIQALKIGAGTLWLLIYLGGIGLRNRRGNGCLKINKSETTVDLPFEFKCNATKIIEAKKYLENSLEKIFNDLFKSYIGNVEFPKTIPNYCVLSQSSAKIALVVPPNKKASDIHKAIGEEYSKYRNKVSTRDLDILGSSLHGKNSIRFASPFIFGLIAFQNGYVVGRIIKFYSSVKNPSRKDTLKNHLDDIDKNMNKSFNETLVSIPAVK